MIEAPPNKPVLYVVEILLAGHWSATNGWLPGLASSLAPAFANKSSAVAVKEALQKLHPRNDFRVEAYTP